MKWFGRKESVNVEDRRGWGGKGIALGGFSGIVVVALSLLFGVDLTQITGPSSRVSDPGVATRSEPQEDKAVSFSKVIFRDTEEVWKAQFRLLGDVYQEPVLVLYDGLVQSACGRAQSAVGPFYCPGDTRVYIDLKFYDDMEKKLHSAGDFARAYVIAHEVGHHVQHLLGYAQRLEAANRGANEVARNRHSVQLELQADFLAGFWAHHAQRELQFLEEGDIDEALNAAFQIGDDRLQKRSQGYVVPDSFTHGTSEQRRAAFLEGFKSGDLKLAEKYMKTGGLGE